MESSPLAHILRPLLPWRDVSLTDTECGRPSGEFTNVVPLDEALVTIRREGIQRARYGFCMTCLSSAERNNWDRQRREPREWMTSPSELLDRELTNPRRRELLDKELLAITELISQHRAEFDDLVQGNVVPIAQLRKRPKVRA